MFKTKKYDMYIERPIDKEKKDLFGINSYADVIKDAINNGSRFIAIDGDFGSGKSSVLNMVKEKYKKNRFVNKVKFVDVNFLNTDKSISEDELLTNSKDDLNFYHRYFVNQVANDICKNPYSIEKIFYNSFISIATTKNEGNILWKIIVDKLLLVLISFITIMITYPAFLKDFDNLASIKKIFSPLIPWILYITFILLIIYGYGIYKPEKQDKSPMLNVDKTRNNFLKVIQNYVISNTTLVFVIDDLDRLDPNIQKNIISLFYNEYYPLNKQIKNIRFCFIFMINIDKIKEDKIFKGNQKKMLNQSTDEHNSNYKIFFDYKKIFDFILKISNNQRFIIRDYVCDCFSKGTLNRIVRNCNYKELHIGYIINNYNDIRSLKHIFNKIINKYRYLERKEDFCINYDELVLLTLLNDRFETSVLTKNIDEYLKNYDYNSSMPEILNEAIDNKIIDKNYYYYLYNFYHKDSLLNNNENKLNDILIDIETNGCSDKKIILLNRILDENDDIRLRKVYDEMFSYFTKKTKLALLTNIDFFKFVFVENEKLQRPSFDIFKDVYQFEFAQQIYLSIQSNIDDSRKKEIEEQICNRIIVNNNEYIDNPSDYNYDKLEKELITFCKNMKRSITYFNRYKLFENMGKFSDDLFNELFVKNNYGWLLYHDNIIDYNNIKNKLSEKEINSIDSLDDSIVKSCIKMDLIQENIPYNLIHALIYSDNFNPDIKNLYIKLSSNDYNVPVEDIKYLIDKYGYYYEIDDLLIKHIDKKPDVIQQYINNNNIDISDKVFEKFCIIDNNFCWKEKYNDRFAKKSRWDKYIYSRINKNNKFNISAKYLKKEECIIKAIEIYGTIDIKKYTIDKNIAQKFLEDKYLRMILVSHINKIGQLSEFMNKDDIDSALNIIAENSIQSQYCNIITSKEYKISGIFLKKFNNRFRNLLSSTDKCKLTKKLKS